MKNIILSGAIASLLYFKSSEITKVNSWFFHGPFSMFIN